MKFRYSALNASDFCLTKYKLQYLDLIPEPGLTNNNYVFGTAIHLALEGHFDGEDPVETFSMYWKSINPEEYNWEGRYDYLAYEKMGKELLTKWAKAHAKHYKPLHVEKQIEFKIGDFEFSGKPDFIGSYKDKLSLVDWKTSAQPFDKRKALVDPQTWLYVAAAKQVYGIDIEQVVYSPFIKYEARVQNPICIEVTNNKLDSMLKDVMIKCRMLSQLTEWPKNNQNCLRCPYMKVCYDDKRS